jgi:hypothetical protein
VNRIATKPDLLAPGTNHHELKVTKKYEPFEGFSMAPLASAGEAKACGYQKNHFHIFYKEAGLTS